MVLFDISFSFVAAGALAWRTDGKRPELPLVFTSVGLAPVCLAFLERYPDWDWQYLVNPDQLSPLTPAFFVGAIGLAALAGHWVGCHRPRWLAAAAAAFGVFCLVTLPRTLHVGTLSQWESGDAPILPWDFVVFALPWLTFAGVVMALCIWAAETTYRSTQKVE